MDVTICVCTFGDPSWADLARTRAIPSATAQGVPVCHSHAGDLAEARNQAADLADTEWLVYLDADDELEPGYITAMASGTADVRAPAVRYVADTIPAPRVMRVAGHDHACTAECLPYGNWVVVGAAVRRQMILDLGWQDFPVYEDWDLWLRCHLAGATFETIPTAVYRAHVRPDSRNRGKLTAAEKHVVHQRIARANQVPVPA